MKAHIIRRKKFNRILSKDFLTDKSLNPCNFYGLVSRESSFIYEHNLAALLRVLKFHFKRGRRQTGKFHINLKSNNFLTRKAVGVRMGKGKGAVSDKVFFLRPGFLILTLNEVNSLKAFYILKKCIRRLPVSCTIIKFPA